MSGDLPEELMDVETDLFEAEEGADEEDTPEVDRDRITVFELGGQQYGTPVLEVREIIETTGITRVPRTAESLDGVMDLRGEIIAVINPWVHLDLPEAPTDWEDQLVAVFTTEEGEQSVGIRIDDIVGVEPFPVEDVVREGDPEFEGPNANNPLVEAVALRREDGEVVGRVGLIDTQALVDVSSQHPHRRRDTGPGR